MLPKFKLPVVDRVVGQTDSVQQLPRRVPSFTKQPVRYYLNDATPHRFIDDLMAAGIDPTLRTFEFDNLLHSDQPKTPAKLPTFPSPDLVSQQQLEPAQHTDNSSILAPSDPHTISVLENSIASETSQSTAISALLLLCSNDTEVPLVDRVGGHTVFSSATATIQEHQTEVLPSPSDQPITRKSRTSAHSRAIHNQKSSKKFHKKDYDIEIIRPIYFQFDIHQAKNILRGLGLRFRKVMIVNRQFLRIGLWAEAQRNEFELRLHHNLFTLGYHIRLYGRPAIQRHSPSRQHQ
ncbi:unnamed protein product [Didymodactylos carnosus]|uniref:Uncharacterized protein n=1 Tax=Didymodactylos carnosus TaxID=1234261 RepID=A0A814NCT2_9BILA|nr:unnamed protein product [Didymodactylos carnosus]CAF3855764.1 unnamed protein product [Didymodactylos carnosus]